MEPNAPTQVRENRKPPHDPLLDEIDSIGGGGVSSPLVYVLALVAGLVAGGLAGMKEHGLSFSSGGSGAWLEDLDAALDEQEETGKMLLVYYTADWCPPCRELRKQVLSRRDVEDFLAAGYVRLKIDLSDPMGPNTRFAEEYDVTGVPTMIVYDQTGDEVERIVGGGELSEWILDQVP